MEDGKVKCDECGWHGLENQVLVARSPFDDGDNIYGCPKCLDVNSMRPVCDEPDCWSDSTCGTPTPDGYRNTCHKHIPKDNQ